MGNVTYQELEAEDPSKGCRFSSGVLTDVVTAAGKGGNTIWGIPPRGRRGRGSPGKTECPSWLYLSVCSAPVDMHLLPSAAVYRTPTSFLQTDFGATGNGVEYLKFISVAF